MTDELRIHIKHVRSPSTCAWGIKRWFAQHDLDFMDFLQHGIPVTTVEAIGDEFGMRAVRAARDEVMTDGK
jgi:hypothetical protein